jgi:hypothetical protein
MRQEISASTRWTDSIRLEPGGTECWELCLEPDERLIVTLAAPSPIDATLVHWDAYCQWQRSGGEGMPVGSRFANDSRSAAWQSWATAPPYIEVVVVRNCGDRETTVTVEAGIAPTTERRGPSPSRSSAGDQPVSTLISCKR